MIGKRWKAELYANFALLVPLLVCFDNNGVEACVLCENLDRNASLSPIPGYASITDCGMLQDLLSVVIDPESSRCRQFQRMGTMCGCQPTLAAGEEPCTFCELDNATLGMTVNLKAEDVEPYSSGLALLVNRITPTCQMVQAYLSSIPANTQECSGLVEEVLAGHCGCPGNATNDDKKFELCQVCPGENDIFAEPERDVADIVEMLGADVFFQDSENITCSNAYQQLSSKPANHILCQQEAKRFFQGVCECPWTLQKRQCTEILNCNVDSFKPDFRLDFFTEAFGFPLSPTCQELVWFMQGVHEDSRQCFAATQFAFLCGCGVRPYLGATTEGEQAALAWTLRIAGLFSAIGSSLILWDVFVASKKRSRNRRLTMLHQLVCGMSFFDVFSSIGNMFSTLPIPEYRYFESTSTPIPNGIYGAKGNSATCTAQGFFLQLGYTSAFYNLVLTVYYVLVIKKGMRETQLQHLKYWFHVPALVAGFGLAFAGIPYYDNIFLFCHIPPAVEISSWWSSEGDSLSSDGDSLSVTSTDSNDLLTVFSIVPISIVFFVGGINMIVIYLHVRKQDGAANRWRMGHRLAQNAADTPTSGQSTSSRSLFSRPKTKSREVAPSNRLSKEVWWQAVFYMASFLMAWPVYYYATFNPLDKWGNFPFWITCCVMYPLQGLWNAIVYFRPRLFGHFRKQERERKQVSKEKNAEGIAPSRPLGATTVASAGNIVTDNSETISVAQRASNELQMDQKENSGVLRDEEDIPASGLRFDMTVSAIDTAEVESRQLS
eukprot:scaffold3216_cov124-Cylindrotheca_fusiformis.AAC.1